MWSYTNVGSAVSESSLKVREAVAYLHKNHPDLVVDGEIQADFALNPDKIAKNYPFSKLNNGKAANVLIFPNLEAANISYKRLKETEHLDTIGPVILGLTKPIHVATLGSTVDEMVKFSKGKVDVVCGIESRGYIFGIAIAVKLGVPFVLIRKKGKLPPPFIAEKYDFIEKKDLYIQFLEQISKFISYKVYVYLSSLQLKRDNEILSNIIDRVQDIIILTNRKNEIELINKKGQNILGAIYKDEKIIVKTSSNFLNQKEFNFLYSGKEISAIGDIFTFSLEKSEELTKTLFVFKEISEFKNYLLSFHGNSSIILLESPQMQDIYSHVSKVAKNDTSVLITGESGTGKEIIALPPICIVSPSFLYLLRIVEALPMASP